ncbi:MAG: hypothetical protein DRH79_04445 [Candidatus Cloacimonadota bacterium]|nr:MAG: hypothetical protein DRH79_04445 [Candidatus Cloacimonadota bacterium]
MIKNDSRIVLILIIFIFCNFIYLWAERSNKTVDIILRTGQGGFNDNRSDIGKLGGGQIAIDLKLTKYPLALSVSGEYYTNSPAPTNPYEISDMTVFNLLYMKKPFKTDRINVFAGGGLGWLKVPKDFSEDKTNTGMVFDLEAGANVRVIWKLGFYAIYKYLYAQKERNNVKVIDFNEHIGMIGISLNLSF